MKILKLHPLANTPIEKVFPYFGWFFKCLCCCCKSRRQERLAKLKQLSKDDKETIEKKISDTLAENNIIFEGSGPVAFINGQSSYS